MQSSNQNARQIILSNLPVKPIRSLTPTRISRTFQPPDVTETFQPPDVTETFQPPDVTETFQPPDVTETVTDPNFSRDSRISFSAAILRSLGLGNSLTIRTIQRNSTTDIVSAITDNYLANTPNPNFIITPAIIALITAQIEAIKRDYPPRRSFINQFILLGAFLPFLFTGDNFNPTTTTRTVTPPLQTRTVTPPPVTRTTTPPPVTRTVTPPPVTEEFLSFPEASSVARALVDTRTDPRIYQDLVFLEEVDG